MGKRTSSRWGPGLVAVLLVVALADAVTGDDTREGSTPAAEPRGSPAAPAGSGRAGDGAGDGETGGERAGGGRDHAAGERRGTGSGGDRQPSPRPRPVLRVTRVVDGDTLYVSTGESVRLAGIDSPELGECGYDEATARLERLVLGRRIRLVRSGEDRDRYGRLLRYVDVVGADGRVVDAGLRQIRAGVATARYDSRDGYGFHPREERYVAADAAAPDRGCPGPRGFAGAAGPRAGADGGPGGVAPGARCAPGYAPCVPSYPPDLDCADVAGPVRVTGADPHALDGDGDGTACE